LVILQRARRIRDSAASLRERRRQDYSRQVWTTHAKALDECAVGIDRPRAFLEWLHGERRDQVTVEGPAVATARSTVRLLLKGLERDPDRVLAGELLGDAEKHAKRAADDLEERAIDAWSAHVDRLPPPDAELYAGLRGQGALANLVEQAERQDRQYEHLRRRKYLESEELRQGFVRLLRERDETRRRLPDIHDNEVREFVTAAAVQGAPLAALTPTVLQWLESNRLTDGYVVRRRSPGR
jgi:hypothetical protein